MPKNREMLAAYSSSITVALPRGPAQRIASQRRYKTVSSVVVKSSHGDTGHCDTRCQILGPVRLEEFFGDTTSSNVVAGSWFPFSAAYVVLRSGARLRKVASSPHDSASD